MASGVLLEKGHCAVRPGPRLWGCVWMPEELAAIPQEMALEDVQHHEFKPGHNQRGQQKGETYLEEPRGAAFTSPEYCVPLGDVLPPFALSAFALLA